MLKVGHTGSSTSTSQPFLEAVNPRWAVISCGEDNRYGHPHRETRQLLGDWPGLTTYRTDQDGTILARSDGETIRFETGLPSVEGRSIGIKPQKGRGIMLTQSKKEFIEFMLSANVLRFGHFRHQERAQHPVPSSTPATTRPAPSSPGWGSYYAALVKDTVGGDFEAMFGPAYKGIPLASACSIALYNDYGIDKPYFFNRKEVKDHGEGGGTVGYAPQDGDRSSSSRT